MISRPKSFSLGPHVVVRRDARRPIWRVFVDSRRVYSTAGQNAQGRALAYGRYLAGKSVGIDGWGPGLPGELAL